MNKYLNLTKERDDWSKAMAQVPQEEFINFEEWVMKAQDRKSRKKQLEQLEKERRIIHMPTDYMLYPLDKPHNADDCWLCAALREVA